MKKLRIYLDTSVINFLFADINKQLSVKQINEREGYFYPLMLTNPMEVMDENEE